MARVSWIYVTSAISSAAVINIGSASGNSGELALTAYGSTKSAVIGFSRYVATQYGKQGVRCNSISPGVILTDSESSVRS
jgi:NAD(P)-dependent dehydrogenase (short-subunit alcohol dehydrogenase family)